MCYDKYVGRLESRSFSFKNNEHPSKRRVFFCVYIIAHIFLKNKTVIYYGNKLYFKTDSGIFLFGTIEYGKC